MGNLICETLDDLRERARLTAKDLADFTDVSEATISWWASGAQATPDHRTQLVLYDLRYVVDRMADLYTPDETRTWLYSKNALLAGGTAIELIRAGRTEEVRSAIEGLLAATYL
jgi:transcriptional regulator with XRE-family HTH domain